MKNASISEIPYDERSDDQKLESNWYKALKLYERKDWSACVVRIATSVEISANIYIRGFYLTEYGLPPAIVDALLKAANGIDGKFNRLIKPIAVHRSTWADLKLVKSKIEELNEHRNSIAHAGSFKNVGDAWSSFQNGLAVIRALAPAEAVKLSGPAEG